MNTLLGTIITALVTDENDKFYFVQKDGVTFALFKEEGEHAIGDMVTGFAYTDSKQKSRLTQKEIKATRDSYDWGEVTEVRKDLGVFVDVGIPDKEIVVSLDVLPELKELWPKKGDKLYIKLDVDKKTVFGGFLLNLRSFNVWLVPLTIICKTKNGQPLPTVSNSQEPLFIYQRITCLVSSIPQNVMLSHA